MKTRLLSVLALTLASVTLLEPAAVQAGTVNSWTGANGNYYWQQDGNWSAGRAPSSSDGWIYVTNATSQLVVVHSYIPTSTLTVSNLTLGAPSGVTNTLSIGYVVQGYPPFTLYDGPFVVRNELDVNPGGKLWISCTSTTRVDNVSGGIFLVDGIVQMDDGLLITTNTASSIDIGVGSNGVFIVNGGMWQAGYIRAGSSSAKTGTLTVNGGSVSASTLHIGPSGSTGTVCVAGGQLTVAANNNVFVGYYGVGLLVVSNGTVSAGEIDVPGPGGPSTGTLLVTGGTLSTSSLNQGLNGVVSFPAGTVLSQETSIESPFAIGDGSQTA